MSARITYRGRDYNVTRCPTRRIRQAVWAEEMRRYRFREHVRAFALISTYVTAAIVGTACIAAFEMGLLS